MASGNVTVTIAGDASSLKRALGESQSALSGFAAQAQKVGDRATSIGRSMTFGVTAPLIGLAKVAFDELQQSAQASAQTEAAIKSTGGAAHVTAKQVDEMATALLNSSGVDDEVIKGGENILLTFRAIRNETGKGNDIFNQATKATLDLSVAFGKDMTSSAILVGKALQDPIQGVSALRRVGVQLNQQQVDSIKAFVAQGDVMSAQKVILKELTTEVGGSADAYGKSMAGQVSKATEEMKNAGAEILASFAPAIKTIADFSLGAAQGLASLPGPLQAIIVGAVGVVAAVGPITYIFGAVSKAVGGAISVFQTLASATETLALKSMYAKQWIGENALAIGAWGIVGGLAIGTAVGLAQAFGDQTIKLQANIAAVRELTQAELTRYIQKVIEVGQNLDDNNLIHSAFLSILRQDSVEAQRFIETLDGMGVKTSWYKGKLQEEIATQQQANTERDAAKQKVDALGAAVNNLPPGKIIQIQAWGISETLNNIGAVHQAINALPLYREIGIRVVGDTGNPNFSLDPRASDRNIKYNIVRVA